MSEYAPVATLADLRTLDEAEIMLGYMEFRRGDPEPGNNRGRSYWHGWMNAARDHGERPQTPECRLLAEDVARNWLAVCAATRIRQIVEGQDDR